VGELMGATWVQDSGYLCDSLVLLGCVLVRNILVCVADPELFEVPRHTVLSQVHNAESPEAMERLSVLFQVELGQDWVQPVT